MGSCRSFQQLHTRSRICVPFFLNARVKMYEQLNCLYGTNPFAVKNARQSIMGIVYKAITTMIAREVKEENAFVLRKHHTNH